MPRHVDDRLNFVLAEIADLIATAACAISDGRGDGHEHRISNSNFALQNPNFKRSPTRAWQAPALAKSRGAISPRPISIRPSTSFSVTVSPCAFGKSAMNMCRLSKRLPEMSRAANGKPKLGSQPRFFVTSNGRRWRPRYKKTRRKLEPVFRTSVHRTTRPIHVRPSEIELAVDREICWSANGQSRSLNSSWNSRAVS